MPDTHAFVEYTEELGKVLNNVRNYVPKTNISTDRKSGSGRVVVPEEETEETVSATADVMVCGRDNEGNGRNLVAGQVICLGDIDEELSNISVDSPEPVYRVYYINPSYDTPTHGRFAVVKSNIAANAVGRATVSGFALAKTTQAEIATFYSREYHAGQDKYRYFYLTPSGLADYGFAKIIEYPIEFEEVPGAKYAIVNLSDFKHESDEKGPFDIRFLITDSGATVKVFNSASPSSVYAGQINQTYTYVSTTTFEIGSYDIYMVLSYNVAQGAYSAVIQNTTPVIHNLPTDSVRTYAVQLGSVSSTNNGYAITMARQLGNIDIYGVWL